MIIPWWTGFVFLLIGLYLISRPNKWVVLLGVVVGMFGGGLVGVELRGIL
jgi:hypothetical protein